MENFHETDIINELGVDLYNTLTKYFILDSISYNYHIGYTYYGKVKDIKNKLGFLEKEIPENKKDEDIINMVVYIKTTNFKVDTLVLSSTRDKMENFNYSREALKYGILNNNFKLLAKNELIKIIRKYFKDII